MYYPRAYHSSDFEHIPSSVIQLHYRVDGTPQVVFYVQPLQQPQSPPDRLWVMFGGNGSVALGWLPLLSHAYAPRAGFLLFDYPGFGLCQGTPTRRTILDSSEQALLALAGVLKVDPNYFEGRIGLVGHSLGCAAALQFAPHHDLDRIVLLSPFTNMVDIARHIVGWPLCNFVLDRFDNRARLSDLARRRPRPGLIIIHGDADPVVPVRMGRELAALYPDWITYHEVHRANHVSFMTKQRDLVLSAMFAPAPAGSVAAR